MEPPVGDGLPTRFVVKVERRSRPPMPWAWAIHLEGHTTAYRASEARYQSAEEAWQAGQSALAQLGRERASCTERSEFENRLQSRLQRRA